MLKVQFVLVVSPLVLFHFSWPFQGPSLHPSGLRGGSPFIWPPAPASKEGPESGGDQSPGLGSRLLCWSRFRQRGSVWGPSRTAPFHVLRSSSRILTTLPSLPWRGPEITSQSDPCGTLCTQPGALHCSGLSHAQEQIMLPLSPSRGPPQTNHHDSCSPPVRPTNTGRKTAPSRPSF